MHLENKLIELLNNNKIEEAPLPHEQCH